MNWLANCALGRFHAGSVALPEMQIFAFVPLWSIVKQPLSRILALSGNLAPSALALIS
jgi:hypothetical protein